MSNEWLEKLARSLAGETLSSGAAGLGAGIGYARAGGKFADIPDVMREEIEAFKQRTQPKSKNEQDAMEVLTALSVLPGRLNPLGVAGHTIDFLKAAPEMLQAKLSGAEPQTGEIMQGGLKRRLAKGGAQAEYALGNQLERAKQAISKDGFQFQKIGNTVPLYSKGANWGPGEGKFQVIQNKASDAFDLNRATSGGLPGMGIEGESRIISGVPHELGVEFANTHGLDPRYRDQSYGKQIYQNMADYYGGGISHSGSTTPEARHVYKSLGGIDTGIPSGGGTRQALPTTAMKADPEAMAAFQKKIDEYALPRGGKGTLPRIEVEDTGLSGLAAYLARKPNTKFSEYGKTPSDAIERLRSNLPEQLRKMPSEPWNQFEYAFPEQILGEISLRLDVQKQPEVLIGGGQAIAAFGSIPDFRNAMRMQGYDAEFSGMSNTFFVKKLKP